ncbi:Protein of unknown function DUF262 [Butyrivibrio sp. Su6]|uniref:GmrSD restriction endonuclease domain-containing protein n=1 Tax=Butyrivibrio sp. Su6 TaxID=1520810 RepID=UPI00089E690D|nr:DUF262 domain-containing protein [Butyrivibrio sp. Su6]SEG16499.1 Protein of unknown function DUF262 [Butyrivibrio sp. Su6]
MNNIVILKRNSTSITISEFYERYKMEKYNFDPAYQRRGDVWNEDKQGFLIDTILKNYPMPPIFLHQKIDEVTGTTKYDVIDGKQRLTAIIKFIEGDLELPQDFDEGAYGDSRLNGLKIDDLEGKLLDYKKQLWRYSISVEYIDTDKNDVVDAIFDRLNRNGEQLEEQELRKAKYHDTLIMSLVERVTDMINWDDIGKMKVSRMQDQEYASELLFYLLNDDASDGNAKETLDNEYKKWNEKLTDGQIDSIEMRFKKILEYIEELDINFDQYKLKGVSHFYAIFAFSKVMIEKNINPSAIRGKLDEFYLKMRDKSYDYPGVQKYLDSMQSNTRSKSQRLKRINALIESCDV